jgi:hypothetical protein
MAHVTNGSSRRTLLGAGALGLAGAAVSRSSGAAPAAPAATPPPNRVPAGERPPPPPPGVRVVNPRGRVPVSFIIDDSTCLVNFAHFAVPQFAEVFPDRYLQDFRKMPREIPDAFVRKFTDWCRAHGVKGKYSIVPYPACVGWIDRDLPGWTKRELDASLRVVREHVVPDWDIHPEMVSHTWAIDIRTGRPFPDRSQAVMENWGYSVGKSADELTAYMAYALRILKNVGLRADGITTPGGFGNKVMPALARATLESCRDVFGSEIPHYFRDLYTDERSVAPLVQFASGLSGPDPRCTVSIVGCTGDWFGGWDAESPGSPDQFITEDGKGGRLPQVIARGEPAVLVCHWAGIYYNGEEHGLKVFQTVVRRLHATYDNLVWMKPSEIARYAAARELTRIERAGTALAFTAPFGTPALTVEIDQAPPTTAPRAAVVTADRRAALKEVPRRLDLAPGTYCRQGRGIVACFDLPKGASRLELA